MSIIKSLIRKTEKIDFLFPNNFDELMNDEYYDYDKFEWFLYHVFKLDDDSVEVDKVGKKGSGDGGADLILNMKQADGSLIRIGIQAKYWKNRVGSVPINQLASAKEWLRLTELWIITTSDLTSDAKEIAETLKIKILRRDDVITLIEAVKKRYAEDIEKNNESRIVFLEPTKKNKSFDKRKAITSNTNEEGDSQSEKELRDLRIKLSEKHKLHPVYNVFNNETMMLLLTEKPTTLEELEKLKGFGKKKTELFGTEIIEFIKKKTIKNRPTIDKSEAELLQVLISERPRIAKYNNISEQEVYSDKVAGYIARMKPRNREQLLKIFGFRKENVSIFGDYLLNIIAKHR